ncbi:MAG: tetratricopeptide repeat-containing sensor histidine kinase [Melioribacteraceae bacterium]|nr:tetratricopeptide repeat-containing sensor histidine kinase [Melioribacteraceae bacterium]
MNKLLLHFHRKEKITLKSFLLILISLLTTSAQIEPSNLIEKLEEAEGVERVELLNEIASKYRIASNFQEAENYAGQSLELAQDLNYLEGIVDAENNLASINLLSFNLETGINLTRSAYKKAESELYNRGIATAFRNIGIYYINSNRSSLALDTLSMALEIFEEINDTLGIASTLTAMGVAKSRTNKIDESIEIYKQVAKLYSAQENSYQAAHAYLNLASIYSTVIGNYEEAFYYSTKALENFETAGDKLKAAYAKLILGITYEELGDLEKPIPLYLDALEVFKESGNKILIANAINNLGEVYKKKKDYEKAYGYYNQTLELSKEIGNDEGVAVALNNLGECSYNVGDYIEAERFYKTSYNILEKLNDQHKMSISLNNQSDIYLKLNNYSNVIRLSQKAVKLAEAVRAREEKRRAHYNLYSAYKESGNYRAALDNFQAFEEIKDSLIAEQRSENTERMLAEFENKQHESEIELLKAQNKLQEAEIERQDTTTLFLILGSFILLVFAGVYYRKYKAHKATNKKLIESEKRLKELNKTKDLFFSIIAHDLKGPFNSLLGITEMLSEDINILSEEEINNLSREVNQNARNVYRLLENLLIWSSTQLGKYQYQAEEFDLNEVVTQSINLYRKMSKDKELTLDLNLGNNTTVVADKNMIDSVIRNLINNAIKFTNRGGKVVVETITQNGNTQLKVKDTGIGMSKDEISKIFNLDSDIKKPGTELEKGTGLGLVLARDFVEKNSGIIEVDSTEGEGSTFTVSLPSNN